MQVPFHHYYTTITLTPICHVHTHILSILVKIGTLPVAPNSRHNLSVLDFRVCLVQFALIFCGYGQMSNMI